jgi:hypothetical protein
MQHVDGTQSSSDLHVSLLTTMFSAPAGGGGVVPPPCVLSGGGVAPPVGAGESLPEGVTVATGGGGSAGGEGLQPGALPRTPRINKSAETVA